MDRRRVFTLSPEYFPVNRMREIVDYLHAHDQQYSEPAFSPLATRITLTSPR